MAVDAAKKGKAFFQIFRVTDGDQCFCHIYHLDLIFDPTSGLSITMGRIGLPPQNLLGHEETAMWTIVAVSFLVGSRVSIFGLSVRITGHPSNDVRGSPHRWC